MQELEAHLVMNLKQLEHRIFQRVHELSGIAAAQHAESDLRIMDLSSSIPDDESGSAGKPETWKAELPVIAAVSDDPVDLGSNTDKGKLTPGSAVPPRPVTPQLSQLEEALRFMESRQSREKMETVSTVSREALDDGLLPLDELLHKLAGSPDTASKEIQQRARLARQLLPILAQNSNRATLFGDQVSHSERLMAVTIRRILQVSHERRLFLQLLERICILSVILMTQKKSSSVRDTNLSHGWLQLLVSSRSNLAKLDFIEGILRALVEMQDAFETCEREYSLYPEPHVKDLVLDLYTEVISGLASIARLLPDTARNSMRLAIISDSHARMISDSIETIQACARKVIKEVEYLHRKELREAHLRLRQIDRKQDQVIRALEEQRRIMLSLQEEQKILTSVNNHQKVLQMLQQLLADKPSTAPESGKIVA